MAPTDDRPADGDPADATVAVRRRAAVVAGHTGDADEARAALDDPDAGVRSAAIGALARLGQLTGGDLERCLADAAAPVRRRAVEAVAALADDPDRIAVAVTLLPLLADDDPTVVEVAAWASGERQPPEPEAVTRLVALVRTHDDALVREAAVAALGAIGDPAGLPAILEATRDKATVRRRAVIALAPFDGPAVDAALATALEDRDWQVRQAAEDLLAD